MLPADTTVGLLAFPDRLDSTFWPQLLGYQYGNQTPRISARRARERQAYIETAISGIGTQHAPISFRQDSLGHQLGHQLGHPRPQ